ncbi:MAG: hypothetical protein K6G33_01965 [Ruminococcus sp.]|uniref:hypothetical protein n=1 Tax=Ruminococcus sp. TaxID=41978 RepID=UPI0025F60551|nr:hypothetical protein [Ruminococcus sp.]MCR5599500.1 hypothetical protein [Ruminococcus sp.]
MNKIFTRTAAILAAAVMTLSVVSCNDNDAEKDAKAKSSANLAGGDLPEDANVKEEDMPYGAEYKQLKVEEEKDLPMSVEFDPRYMTDEEAKQVVNYFWSLSSKDPSYLEKAVHPDLLKYRLDEAGTTAQDFLNKEYDIIKGYAESDFTFTFTLVDGILKADEKASDFEFYDSLVEKAIPHAKVTDKKLFMVNCTYSKPDDTGVYSLQMRLGDYVDVAVYTIDGKPYIIS